MTEEEAEIEAVDRVAGDLAAIVIHADLLGCIKQFVINAARNVKFRFVLQAISQFIVMIVLEKVVIRVVEVGIGGTQSNLIFLMRSWIKSSKYSQKNSFFISGVRGLRPHRLQLWFYGSSLQGD
jgi:hypothetical protein